MQPCTASLSLTTWLRTGCSLASLSACGATLRAPSDVAMLVIAGNSTRSPASTDCANASAPAVSTAITGTSFQPWRCKPAITPHSKPPPPTDNTTASGLTPASAISSMMLAWPSHNSGSSYGWMNASPTVINDCACALASWKLAPCTTISAPSRAISARARALAVSGTTTSTGTPSWRPEYAAAMPAFPPEDEMNRFAPRRWYSAQAWPMPRSLNEPIGCRASILSQTVWPGRVGMALEASNGVAMCKDM